jgi:hypothetical protein
LETEYSTNKFSPEVIKGHEDCDDNNSKSSTKMPFLSAALRCPFLGNILNLLISEVAYALSNLPKTIIQIQHQIIHLYLVDSSSVHRGELSNSG